MPGGSAREGVCIAAGVAAVGGCERMNEKGVRGGAAYSSQQNHSNVFNLWKDALLLHEINFGKF
jgi:hypothetical protein